MAIRYDKKLRFEIDETVRKYNNKIRRLSKSGYNKEYIPKRFDEDAIKSLKKSSKNRNDLKRKLKQLEDFTKRGGEELINREGKILPRYQYKAITRYRSLIKRRLTTREKFAKETHETTFGEADTYTIAQQFNLEYQNIQAVRDKLLNVSLKDLDTSEYLTKLEKNARTVNLTEWQSNYLEMLKDVAELNGIDKDKFGMLSDKLKELSPTQFDKLIKTERSLKQMIYFYKEIEDLGIVGASMNQSGQVEEIFDSLFENMNIIIDDYKTSKDTELLGLS